MKIAIASGKGGTGKTTFAVNLALAARTPLSLLDCDVEAPNAHLFLKGKLLDRRSFCLPVPVVDEVRCTGCGACSAFCAYNAIVSFGTHPVISEELCHGCGGCMRLCPQKAIHEEPRQIGLIETFDCGTIRLTHGKLDIGSALAPPLIRAVKQEAFDNPILIDAPPGTSCAVQAALHGVDYVLLVTEPTPFGLNDLRLSLEMVRALGLPFGVAINRALPEDPLMRPYLLAEKIPLLAEIPEDRRLAEAYANGNPAIQALPEYETVFKTLFQKIAEVA